MLLICTCNFEIQTDLTVSKQILKAKNEYFQKEGDARVRKREATRLLGQLDEQGIAL